MIDPPESQLESVGRPQARWLDVFAAFQMACGVVFLGAGLARVLDLDKTLRGSEHFLPVPLFCAGFSHLGLGWAIWWRRRWFWMPHLIVLSLPILTLCAIIVLEAT